MENDLIVRKQMDPEAWSMIRSAAPMMHRSRLFGVATEEQAMAIMMKGYEMGLGFSASFELIQVVEGKPTLIPRGALALAYQSGLVERLVISENADASGTPFSCTVEGKRKGGFEYSITYSMDDAKRAGLVKPGSAWEKYPANMLKWRAIGFWIDTVLPDVQGGMKRADEFGAAVDDRGNVIDGGVAEMVVPVKVRNDPLAIAELMADFGKERVEDAIELLFDGNVPENQEDRTVLRDFLLS